ncbi:MAG: hypothetical protein ACXW13_00135 [Burkholderiaceae bacterium]
MPSKIAIHHHVNSTACDGNYQIMEVAFWINTARGRLFFAPLIIACASMSPAQREAKINEHAAWLRETLESLRV